MKMSQWYVALKKHDFSQPLIHILKKNQHNVWIKIKLFKGKSWENSWVIFIHLNIDMNLQQNFINKFSILILNNLMELAK